MLKELLRKYKDSCSQQRGISWCLHLLTHVQMNIEQNPDHLDIVHKAIKNEQFLDEIIKKMKKENSI